MIKMLIIADDFTGALDTGAQFAQMGIGTRVMVGRDFPDGVGDGVQVAVLNCETRHLPPGEARAIVRRVCEGALAQGVPHLYKKTDSALRGNVGAELQGMLEAAGGAEVCFLPALPRAGRTTAGGVQYLDGLPIAQSVFGRDPFEPVRHSDIAALIRGQADIETAAVPVSEAAAYTPGRGRIAVFDAGSDGDLRMIAGRLRELSHLRLLAGCAGLASILPEVIPFQRVTPPGLRRTGGMLVVCGSLNPITLAQLDITERAGFARVHLGGEQLEDAHYLDTAAGADFLRGLRGLCEERGAVIIDTLSPGAAPAPEAMAGRRENVARWLGELVWRWTAFGLDQTVLLTGGDTLMGFMERMAGARLSPVCEMDQGAVASLLPVDGRELQVISKSGGFGSPEVMLRIAEQVMGGEFGDGRKTAVLP